jgi:Bacterial antitoxin of type II TA system, VapB
LRTNIEIDDELMAEAMAALGCRTKKETVETALRSAVRMRRELQLMDLIDPDTFWPGYDPEAGDDSQRDEWDSDGTVPH